MELDSDRHRRIRLARQAINADQRAGRSDPVLAELRLRAALTGNDRLLQQYLERNRLPHDQAFHDFLMQQAMGFPFLAPLEEELQRIEENADFELGICTPGEFRIAVNVKEMLTLGMSIVAGTGMGKTTLLSRLAQAIDVGCWIFNVRPEVNDRLRGFTKINASQMAFNPFERWPFLTPEVQAARVADRVASAFYLQWMKTGFSDILLDFYRREESPTIEEVRERVLKISSGKSSGLDQRQVSKLAGVAHVLCQSFSLYSNLRHGVDPTTLAASKLVIELDVGDAQFTHGLFITTMLDWLYCFNVAHGHRDRLRTVFLVDESRYLLSLEREKQSVEYGSPVLDQIICEQRSAGLALVAATQTGHPKAYSTNTASKFLFRTGDARFFQMASDSMGLNRQQVEYGKRLETGQAIVTLWNHPQPLLLKLHPLEFTPEPEHVHEDRRRAFLDAIRSTEERTKPAPTKNTKTDLVPGSEELLLHAAMNDPLPITKLYTLAGLNTDQGTHAQKHLVENQLAEAASIQLYAGRGGRAVVLLSTTKGLQHLRTRFPSRTKELKRLPGKGGVEHRVHAHLVARHFLAEDWIVKEECAEADLGVQRIGSTAWTAVEIANEHSRNIEQRVAANRDAGAERTIVVCSDVKTTDRLKLLLHTARDVAVHSISQYLIRRSTTE